MRQFAKFAVAGALAAASLAVATPSLAEVTTFATYVQEDTGRSLTWTKSGAGGALTTTGGSYDVRFSFLDAALSALTNLEALFTFSATSSSAASGSTHLVQPDLAGAFNFIYNGDADLVIGTRTLSRGANLLSAVFSGAEIAGRKNASSGNLEDATATGGSITFTSDVLDFSKTTSRDFALALTAISPRLNASTGQGLNNFQATSAGAFSSDPAPIISGIPEPGAWALMLIGFAGIGAVVRSSRREEEGVLA